MDEVEKPQHPFYTELMELKSLEESVTQKVQEDCPGNLAVQNELIMLKHQILVTFLLVGNMGEMIAAFGPEARERIAAQAVCGGNSIKLPNGMKIEE